MKLNKTDLMLYAVTDRSWLKHQTLKEQVEQALIGGATFVQLREKNLEESLLIKEARQLKELCKTYQRPFVINDDVEVALKVDADGVHIGQDMDVKAVRSLLGDDKILGVSAHTVDQALYAEACGADYLGVGAIFQTSSKDDAQDVSYEMLKAICESVSIPVVAIGGIHQKNIMKLAGSGIAGVAIISAIFSASDITVATETLKELTQKMLTGVKTKEMME